MARAKGSQRLQLVVELAQRKRREADLVLKESRAKLIQAEQGLEQLQAFLKDYVESTRLAEGTTVTALEMQMPAAFVGRLRGSITQQRQVIAQFRQQHAEVESWWRKLYAREKAISKLQQNLRDQEAVAGEKQLQKELDELWQNRPINPQ